ncbi:GCD1 Nucleoside-diphosphate-sugar pyrophosphorylase involved in lipopolysaccharide biosynthesis/translation initiation factor 2B, gamma/epsilon subunits (eIF-2Bgamma/eIF-2Bepsilon) [Candidatus Nanopelagicaceae bacterium]
MPVVLLAGGMGTRLREETEFRPKPMVEIGGRPILWHIMKYFSEFGFNNFIICLGYKGDSIRDYFLNYHTRNISIALNLGADSEPDFLDSHGEEDWKVTLVDTGRDSLTGERLKKVQKYIGDRTFICTYGDGLANIDLDALLEFHRSNNGIATLSAVHPTSRFGVVDINAEGLISDFHEKPVVDDWINGGYFVLEPKIFDFINGNVAFEDAPLKKLADSGNLYAYKHAGFWQPMDTYREYLDLNAVWDSGAAEWKIWNGN